MKNKLISISLVFVLILSLMLAFSGCGNSDYPVEVANYVIKSEPENIVVLDAPTADIISYIGYDIKMVGRSDEVNQEWMQVVPSVGSASNPDAEQIKNSGATVVFAGETLDSNVKESLEDSGIQVITMSQANTPKQLETNYITLGKILGGKVTGANKGAESYGKLIDDMEKVKDAVTSKMNSDILYTVCYIYFENNQLKMMTSGTYGDMLLSYTGAVNAAVNIEESKVDVNTLKIANPNFIFYADDATLNAIKADGVLGKLTAVKNGKILMVTSDEMERQGLTAIDTLQKMVQFMYPEIANPSATNDEAAKTGATVSATETTTEAVSASVADKYKIKLDDKLSLKIEDDNDNVKAMQQRLYDLGYITDKENITGYYGEITQAAVKQFQKKNNIKESGTADNATLKAMFDSNAVKAK